MRTLRQALSDGAERLAATGVPDARLDAEWLLSGVVGMPRLTMLLAQEEALSAPDAARYETLLARRAEGEPLQYVLGEADFMGHTFHVDARVLIPRCDTETLCEAAISRLSGGGRMLDIGTGSGALAIAVKLAARAAKVTGSDISRDALWVAEANGRRLGADVTWKQSDLFASLSGERFDVIVSNPPYIPSGEFGALQREVRREPRQALDGGADGLAFYRRIAAGLPAHLMPGGSLLLETGDGQAQAVSAMLKKSFESIKIIRDLKGLERVVAGDRYAG